jgi:acetyl-CoA acetyltransferase
VAVVGGDAVASQPTPEFLDRANASVAVRDEGVVPPASEPSTSPRQSAAIPSGYDRVAAWHMERYGLSRRQLAMAACLMSLHGSRHPHALSRR